MYLDATFGPLLLDNIESWMSHMKLWPAEVNGVPRPIVAHAERQTLGALLFVASLYNRPVHIAHVSRREEILLIRAAKEKGVPVTCEVCPHHLFLTTDDFEWLPAGRREVRPRVATPADRDALWANLDVVDCFATDHAPHLLSEKDSDNPPPGFPGVETMLPLLLTAVHKGRLTLDDITARLHDNPKKIFGLPDQPNTWVEVDPDAAYEIRAANLHSRCGWTPFEGWKVSGCVTRVILRGREAYHDGVVLAPRGFGQNVRLNH
jgi:carbamoyl-phosphate synthase/aspartate carbamoyltransferase/dihydroorotase